MTKNAKSKFAQPADPRTHIYVLLLESTYEPQISLKKLTKLNESKWFL